MFSPSQSCLGTSACELLNFDIPKLLGFLWFLTSILVGVLGMRLVSRLLATQPPAAHIPPVPRPRRRALRSPSSVYSFSDSTPIVIERTRYKSSGRAIVGQTQGRRTLHTPDASNMGPKPSDGKPKPKFEVLEYTTKKNPVHPSPSASIILVAPNNQILLLHRTKSSSAFPSAHVFPGGNLDPQDGHVPPEPTDPERHKDSLAYRTGAIRELFEETGILLAKASATATSLLPLSPEVRLSGRKAVHSGKISFKDWLAQQSKDAVLHTDGLTPFTHWVTPTNVPKRFTTQMYIYFVHLKETDNPSISPSPDHIETMSPEYRPAHAWLSAAQAGSVILFPPQFLLLHLASEFLDLEHHSQSQTSRGVQPVYGDKAAPPDAAEIVARRRKLYKFIVEDRSPPWSHMYISPIGKGMSGDGRSYLALDDPGPELKGSGLKGDTSRVVMVKFQKEGPRHLDVRMRDEVLAEMEKGKGKAMGRL